MESTHLGSSTDRFLVCFFTPFGVFHVEFGCAFEIVVEWMPFAGLPMFMIFYPPPKKVIKQPHVHIMTATVPSTVASVEHAIHAPTVSRISRCWQRPLRSVKPLPHISGSSHTVQRRRYCAIIS